MRKSLFAFVAAASMVGCTAAPTAKAPIAPSGGDRSIMATSPMSAPTVQDMKRILPASLTPEEAAKKLIRVNPGQVRLPGTDRKTKIWGAYGLPSIYGLYPFSWGSSLLYAPYYLDTLGLYSPFFLSSYALSYPYLLSPFSYLSTLGCYAPFGYYGLGIWPYSTII